MLSMPSISRRSLALLLPLSFIWAFAGCVLLCSTHNEQGDEYQPSISAQGLVGDDDCERCTLVAPISGVLPVKQSYLPLTGDGRHVEFSSVTLLNDFELQCRAWWDRPPHASDPP